MKSVLTIFLPILMFLGTLSGAVEVVVVHQSTTQLKLSLDVSAISSGDLVPYHINIGLPGPDLPEVKTNYNGTDVHPFEPEIQMEHGVKWIAVQKHRGLYVGTLEVIPWLPDNRYNPLIEIDIDFSGTQINPRKNHRNDSGLLASKIINWGSVSGWIEYPRQKVYRSTTENGTWFNIKIATDGIYRITGSTLHEISPLFLNSDPGKIKFYTNSQFGSSQPESYGLDIPENLVEVSATFSGNEDQLIDADEYFIFYASGADGYQTNGNTVSYRKNLYFTENNYWIFIPEDTSSAAKRVQKQAPPDGDGLSISKGYRRLHIENDLVNPFRSGLAWAGETISFQGTQAFDLDISSVSPSSSATLSYRILGGNASYEDGSSPLNRIEIRLGSSQNEPLTTASWYGYTFRSGVVSIPGDVLSSSPPRLFFRNATSNNASEPMLDYLNLKYEADLEYEDNTMQFYPPENVGGIFTINVKSDDELVIWNITDPSTPEEMNVNWASGTSFFKTLLQADSIQTFIAFREENAAEIEDITISDIVSFTTIRNTSSKADHIILGPKEFRSAAQPLVDHRSNSVYVSLESVYNEFAGGNTDPYAIRNFIQWTQEFWQKPAPTALFILGDADYDYRNITGTSEMVVPTIESGTTNSYASDDFLAAVYGLIPEIAIGRLPITNSEQVSNFVEKLIQFETAPELGLWRQKVTLVADDGARPEPRHGSVYVGKSHTLNSETLAGIVPGMVGLKKFYMLDYPEVSDASSYGVIKPSATEGLLKLLESGTALINYIGHGSAHQWAQERLLVQDRDMQLINTGMKLPVWVAGTCSWGHFDDMNARSFAEDLINAEMNGASAIITTSRPISVSGNAQYTTDLFRAFFPGGKVSNRPLGELLHSIKTPYRESRYFHLFGDPGMPFSIPHDTLLIADITPDTLKTLETGTFAGTQNISANGGIGYAIVQDADYEVTREYNISSTTESLSYLLPGRELFRGKIDIPSESFSGQVRIPLDISYSTNNGKMKLYFISNDSPPSEALGYYDSIYLAGGDHVEDNMGPIISLQIGSGRLIRSGDHVQAGEEILIRLADPLGINTAGEIGHEIYLTDKVTGQSTDLTEFFTYDNNSITEGTIPLPVSSTANLVHINIKAWDSANNPNEKEFVVYLKEKEDLKIFQVYNFPNPFSSETRFQFEITQDAELSLEIYTTNGRKIYSDKDRTFTAGTHFIEWDGKDGYGDEIANGVYLFRIKAKSENGTVSHMGQVAKFR